MEFTKFKLVNIILLFLFLYHSLYSVEDNFIINKTETSNINISKVLINYFFDVIVLIRLVLKILSII